MDLVERVKILLLQPKFEWPKIEAERPSTQELFTHYVMILAAIGPVASFIGMSVFGIEVPFLGRIRTPFFQGVLTSLLTFGLSLVILFILSSIINWLAPTFGGLQDKSQAMKLAAYGFTAAWVGGIFSLIPVFAVFGLIAALYSLYLLYTGLPVLMKSSPDRSLGYLVSVLLVGALIMIPTMFLFMLVNGAVQAPIVSLTSDPATDAAVQKLESFAKGMEAIGKNVEQSAKAGLPADPPAALDEGRSSAEQSGAASPEADLKQAAQAVGALLSAMGQTVNDGKAVVPVDFRVLKTLLPETLLGMPRSEATGEREAMMGIDRSEAKATYSGPNQKRITVELMDVGGTLGSVGLAAFSWAAAGIVIDKETSNGYEKTTNYRGYKAYEKYNTSGQTGEISLLVNDHTGVTVKGSNISADDLRGALDQINLSRLASSRS